MRDTNPPLYLYNTLIRDKQEFVPVNNNKVNLYTCGPTVYGRAHIGNLRAYIFADVLRRTLEYNNYKVKHVMNITDVGHLTDDADSGEDKLQKKAKEEKSSAWDIAERYTSLFLKDIAKLNINRPHVMCKATDHIKDQIEMIKKIEEKGYSYLTDDGVYFNSIKFSNYAELGRLNIDGLMAGKRIDMGGKKNKTDFALWKFSKENENRDMEWDSPWGVGFPGWHIECSAMSVKYLADTIDIHTGGIDHIPIHHTNEIAQSEVATGKKFVNYWLHSDFLNLKDEKMSKSLGNIITLDTLENDSMEPNILRLICLKAHYRQQILVDKEIFKSAKTTYSRLKKKVLEFKNNDEFKGFSEAGIDYVNNFKKTINNDLNTPACISLMWDLIKNSKISNNEKYQVLLEMDRVLGFNFINIKGDAEIIPDDVNKLAELRQQMRIEKNWGKADDLRKEITVKGFQVKDTSDGFKISKLD